MCDKACGKSRKKIIAKPFVYHFQHCQRKPKFRIYSKEMSHENARRLNLLAPEFPFKF